MNRYAGFKAGFHRGQVYWDAAEAMGKDPGFRKVSDVSSSKGAQWNVGEAYDKQFKLDVEMAFGTIEGVRSALKKYGYPL